MAVGRGQMARKDCRLQADCRLSEKAEGRGQRADNFCAGLSFSARERALNGKPICIAVLALLVCPAPAQAMHLAEGVLPASWAGFWFLVAIPFVWWGLRTVKNRRAADPQATTMIAMVGAAIFVISCMPVPIPWIGSCSHPCGTGLGAMLIGGGPTIVVASIALLLQALFLAHGGLTTLGADIVSMGVAGALSACAVFWGLRSLKVPVFLAAFAAGTVSDWATYTVTSLQLATALHGDGSLGAMFVVVLLAFVPTQLPLGLAEGLLTALAYRFVLERRPELLGAKEEEQRTKDKEKSNWVFYPLLFVLCSSSFVLGPAAHGSGWEGVDRTVVEKFAEEAGQQPSEPFLNTDQGDLLLFLFLLAGTGGGFVMGYNFRVLFPPTPVSSDCGKHKGELPG